MTKQILTQEYLQECMNYEPETGVFTWKEASQNRFKTDSARKAWNTKFLGKSAGCLHWKGYLRLWLKGRLYSVHRLAFLYMTGEFPINQVDHINHDRTDNRWINLRDVTNKENGMNASKSSLNKSGFTGVCFYKPSNKWTAQIGDKSKKIYLGIFDKKEDAIAARKNANINYGFHENHGG